MATQPVQRAQVENLYVEAMLLADEAHAAFRAHRDFEAVARDPILQVGMACESLKTTTRLMMLPHPVAASFPCVQAARRNDLKTGGEPSLGARPRPRAVRRAASGMLFLHTPVRGQAPAIKRITTP